VHIGQSSFKRRRFYSISTRDPNETVESRFGSHVTIVSQSVVTVFIDFADFAEMS
jgi:hypothetical protein